MPRDTATGFIIAVFGGLVCFGLIWHIYWMIMIGFIGIFASVIVRSLNMNVDYYVKADQVEKIETAFLNAKGRVV
jgi:cytochrome o ubiquinol oxidase subunit 1